MPLKDSSELYEEVRPVYEEFSKNIRRLIGEHCGKELIHTTEARAKRLDSFVRKCSRKDDQGKPRYPEPMKDITDLAGVRIIVFVRDSVDAVCQRIDKILKVIEFEDVGERVYSGGKFGYQSKHLLVTLGDDRSSLVENAHFKGMVCEVQVRTLLQHAWAEMEHDIQYKSDKEIPVDLKKRFSALAGLLEIADREFQNIQRDSDNLKEAVRAELITDLTRQGLAENTKDREGSGQVRALVSERKYAQAIDIYTAKMKAEPKSATLYIGRAKAKFLAGDTSGAIMDLEKAEKLNPNDRATAQVRFAIEHGDTLAVTSQHTLSELEISQKLWRATNLLEMGDGVEAFEEYNLLDSVGYNKAIVLFGKAMCCTLERDVAGGRGFLSRLRILPATPMSVNICALHCVLDILESGSVSVEHEALLEDSFRGMPNYRLEISPMRALLLGLRTKALPQGQSIEQVFISIGADGQLAIL